MLSNIPEDHQEDPGQVGQHRLGRLRRQLRRVLKGREKGHGDEHRPQDVLMWQLCADKYTSNRSETQV